MKTFGTSSFSVVAVGLIVTFASSSAQEMSSYTEQYRKIRAPEAVQAVGTDVFGDKVNLYTGMLEFVQTDVSIPGNSQLPVAVGRRLQTGQSVSGQRMFGTWDLEIPHLHGIFGTNGWKSYVQSTPLSRCTNFGPPPDETGSTEWAAAEFWNGNFLYVPGSGDQAMLWRDVENKRVPTQGGPYKIVTKNQWAFSCLPTLQSPNPAGEGFLAWAPDGTRYQFDWMVSFPLPSLSKTTDAPLGATNAVPQPPSSDGTPTASPTEADGEESPTLNRILRRQEVWILPTLITDRYGNTVRYTYDGAHPKRLLRIEASDGRYIAFTYSTDTTVDDIQSVTAGSTSCGTAGCPSPRTWTYRYEEVTLNGRHILASVTLPDQSSWQLSGLTALLRPPSPIAPASCDDPATFFSASDVTGTATSPSGATGAFTLRPTTHVRTGVPRVCLSGGNGHWYSPDPLYFYTFSLVGKSISGTGISTSDGARSSLDWTYAYYQPPANWGSCSVNCEERVDVVDPESNTTRHWFGTASHVSDGLPIATQWDDQSGHTARRQTFDYQQWYQGVGYPQEAGVLDPTDGGAGGPDTRFLPIKKREIQQQGETFTWEALAFDDLARPTKVRRSSSTGPSRTESTVYADFNDRWVLGQIADVIEGPNGTGKKIVHRDFDGAGNVRTVSTFGRVDQTLTYNGDGTLATRNDGLHTTTYKNYRAGLAQDIQYADSTSERADVDGLGLIRSLTDASGATTSLAYDSMGRLSQVNYPTGDTVNWHPTYVRLAYITNGSDATEFGIAGPHWRQIVDVGPENGPWARTVTIFDALWRPIMTRTSQTNADGATARAIGRRFDSAGRITFESYPGRKIGLADLSGSGSSVAGRVTTYDPLGRTTAVASDTELPDTPARKTFRYENSFSTIVTDERNVSTPTYFQAFDNPDESFPALSYPWSGKIEWSRDVYGKPLAVTKSGKDINGAPISATRQYVYDANERLCKRLDPETGATIVAYDAANNLLWRATGLRSTYINTTSCDNSPTAVPSNAKVNFAEYNVHNQLKRTTFGDGSPEIVRQYTPDGLLDTISTSQNVVWKYAYNKRRLLERETLSYGGANYVISHAFDSYGAPYSITYPVEQRKVYFAPTMLGQPTQLCTSSVPAQCGANLPGTFAYAIQTHPNGAVQFFNYGNGILHILQQNVRGLPLRAIDEGVLNYGYSYDAAANVVNIGDAQANGLSTRGIDYDPLQRVKQVRSPNMFGTITYTYDGLDNIVRKQSSGYNFGLAGFQPERDERHSIDYATNRLTGITDVKNPPEGAAYTYDALGNIASRRDTSTGVTQQFTFDLNNRLTAVPGYETHVYDGHGRLVSTVANGANTVTVYDINGQLVYTTDTRTAGTTIVRLHNSPVAQITGTTVKYFHTDALGSPVANTDQSKTVTSKSYYYPFGGNVPLAGAQPQPLIGFSGHLNVNPLKLVYMQQRYYDPQMGRFLSVDPVNPDPQNGASFNRYTYANNNPYGYVDPDGRQAQAVVPFAGTILLYGAYKYATDPQARDIINRMMATPSSSQFGPKRSDSADTPQSGENSATNSGGKDGTKVQPPVPGATEGEKTGGGTRTWTKPGGFDEANKDFDKMNPSNVGDKGNGVRVGTLEDGRRVIVRPDSSDGRPTIEIQRPDGKRAGDKIRYD